MLESGTQVSESAIGDNTIRLNKAIAALSMGAIVGFIVGLISFHASIVPTGYIQYGMFRLTASILQESLNKWMFLSIVVVSFVAFLVELRIRIKDRRMLKVFWLSFVSILFFFLSTWALRRYWLPEKSFLMNILVHAEMFLLAIILGRVLMKMKWKTSPKLLRIRHTRKPGLVLIVFLLLLNLGIIIDRRINSPTGPNIVLIIVDTLRADHVGCYGYSRNTTPSIDRLSLNSILFKNAISAAPWTTPSIGSMFTSQYPAVLGFRDKPIIIDQRFLTLTEIFKENNYVTKGIISHAHVSSALGFGQGFDSYDEENAKGHGYISSPSITEKAICFLRTRKNRKFFLFLHYFDPHFDYILHEDYDYYPDYNGPLHSSQPIRELREKAPQMTADDARYIKALYDSEISFTDEHIGVVLDELKNLGLYDNTLIILTADHGEEFLERGDYWIGHTKKLYQEQIHVPLIMKLPGHNEQEIMHEYLGLINLMPTIVDYAGLWIPGEYRCEGQTIDMSDIEELGNRAIFSQTRRWTSLQSVTWKGWKLIYNPIVKSRQLFNLQKDPAESRNLARENDKALNAMEIVLQKWNGQIKSRKTQAEEPDFAEEQKRHLRSLGYLQ